MSERARILRFAGMGVANVAVNYAVFAGLVLAGVESALALLAGTIVSVAFAYAVGGRIVFGNRGLDRLPRFLALYAFTYAINAGALVLLERGGVAPLVGQVLLIPPIVVLTYLLQRSFVFAAR